MEEVIKGAVQALKEGENCVLVTVVRTKGSTPQKSGAMLLVKEDGSGIGTLGGGCVEGDIWFAATEILQKKTGPEFKDYYLNEDIAARDGLVCGGSMYFFLDPLHEKEDDHDDHDDHEEGGHDGHDHDYEFDPHIWLDPILVKQQVNVIRDGLIQVDPDNKENYEENARIYNDKLDALDMKIGSALSSCQKDTIVPYHNAFTYLGERYDIHIMALGGMAPDSEASAAEIAEFVDFVKDNDIKVIFSEELVDPRLAEVIAEEANAQVMLFSPLEALSKEEAATNVSYIDKMEDNLDSLKVALECQ